MRCALALAALHGAAFAQQGCFTPFASLPSGSTPSALVKADFDADGKLDLAVCNHQGAGSVSILRSLGGGAFADPVSYPVAPYPRSIACADLDHDGDADLGMWCPAGVSVLLNQGNGTFGAVATYPGTSIFSFACADLDGDSDADFAMLELVTPSSSRVRMLPNLGNGTFGPATSFAPIPFVANCFALADFDRDGDMDVAIGAVSQRLLLFFDNDGAGTFSFFNGLDLFYSLGGILKSLACADLDGDHFVDIVLFHEAFSAVPAGTWRGVVLRNQFQGHFAMPTNEPQFGVGLGVADVCTADLDGDGRTDFLVSNTADNAVTHLANFVNGVPLTNETLLVGATPYTPRGALGLDVDGDGDEDLIATHHGANSLSITGNCRINGVPFCFGDGTGTACPCSNDGAPGHGCANSVDPNGARLRASGGASLAHDSSQLLGDSMPDGPLLYFQGTALAASLAFGDGLKCTSGALIRLGIVFNAGHASVFPAESGTLATLGLVSGPGARHYQARYRDAASFCTLDTFNYTNGVTLLWVP